MSVGPRVKTGKVTVTAAQFTAGEIDVDVGFTPNYLKVSIGSAGTGEIAALERFDSMGSLESIITNTIVDSGTSGDRNIVPTNSAGLSIIDSNDVTQEGTALTVGTSLDITAGSTTVTGVGTLFTTEVKVGDRVRIGNELLEVESITSNLVMDTVSAFGNTSGPDAATVVVAGAEVEASGVIGFKIPIGDMVAGDILFYFAITSQFDEDE